MTCDTRCNAHAERLVKYLKVNSLMRGKQQKTGGSMNYALMMTIKVNILEI